MTRQRKIKTRHNIKYVHEANGRLVYRPYIKKSERHEGIIVDSRGFLKPPIKLGKPDDSADIIMGAYLAAKSQIKTQDRIIKGTLGYIVREYQKSRQYKSKAVSSQKRDKNLIRILQQKTRVNNKPCTLADIHIDFITKPLMNAIAEKRLADYKRNGKKGEVQVNREITFLSGAISWAVNYMPNLGINLNPLLGLKKIKEPKNERYVTDEDYFIQFKESAVIAPYLQPVFELTYLMGLRGIETLDLRQSDCTDDGIRTHRRKGSKDNIIEWSDRLTEAFKHAVSLRKKFKIHDIDPYLIVGNTGGRMPKSTLDDAMQRLKRHMTAKGLENSYWSLHKLKSKAQSDAKNKDISGLSETMKRHYDTKVHKVDPAR